MKLAQKVICLTLAVLIPFLLIACGAAIFAFDKIFLLNPDSSLKVNYGAAVAVAGIGSDTIGTSSKSALRSKLAEDEDALLVQILANGTIEPMLTVGETRNQPKVAFMSVGNDGSVYVGFESFYEYVNYEPFSRIYIQMVRIYPEGETYDVIWPIEYQYAWEDSPSFEMIEVWNWWGMEKSPMVKGPDGELYFKVGTPEGGSSIFMYDPDTPGTPASRVTPEGAKLVITAFSVDSEGRLFIQNEDTWAADATYLRYYTPDVQGYNNIYYSSDSDTWVRGYSVNPTGTFMILNGQNIRSMNGIIKVNILGAQDVTYEIIYSNANNNINWIRLSTSYWDDWENGTEIIDNISPAWDAASFEWRDDVKTTGVVDIDKIIQKIFPYFNSLPSIKTGNITAYANSADVTGTSVSYQEYITGDLVREYSDGVDRLPLWRWIADDGHVEQFLNLFFDGQLFKDWLVANGMNNINFNFVGSMLWTTTGSLYGLYNPDWWDSVSSDGTKILKLLDETGNRDLQVVDILFGDANPSMMKIRENSIYYRYAMLDTDDEETGLHGLAKFDVSVESSTEIIPSNLVDFPDIEILDYDVSSDESQIYFLGANPFTNEVINGKIDVPAGTWELIDSTIRFSDIKVVE